jgi:hypothetical protein
VIVFGFLGRAVLPKKLSRIPRLSLVFTFVAMSMVLSVSLMAYFDIGTAGTVILLPIVILTALVDRFYSYMDKAGTHAALIRMGTTAIIAALCLPVLGFEALGHLMLSYPEGHFITVALILAFSAYKGRNLTDLPLLRILGEPTKAAKSQQGD